MSRPGPCSAVDLGARLLGLAVAAGAVAGPGPWWARAGCGVAAAAALLGVPRRLRLVEVALAGAILATIGASPASWAWLAVTGAALLCCALAPEAGLLRLNGLDRFFLAEEYPGMAVNSHVVLDTDGPLERETLDAALEGLVADVPLLRSFVREAPLGTERFHTATAWLPPRARWLDAPDEAHHDEPFDLGRAPPWRVVVAPREGGGWRAVMTIHHSVGDGTAQFLLFGALLRRYADRRAGLPPSPLGLPPAHARFRDLFRPQGWRWLLRMVRRHVHPMAKVGVKNASLLEDERLTAGPTLVERLTLEAPEVERLQAVATARGANRNHLLLASALRAGAAWRAARGRPPLPFRIMFPADLRGALGLGPCLGNFVGVVHAEFSPAEVAAPGLERLIAGRVEQGKLLEEAVETPVNLGVVSALLPTWLFRRELRRFDEDPETFFFSFLFSAGSVPPLTLPDHVAVEALWARGAMAGHPGLGLIALRDQQRLRLVAEYRHPLLTAPAARELLDRLRADLEAQVAPVG